ncbi:MAG: response regulator [Candidatus Aminicenantes bacterium]|nr:response regulator [Candidatus Aminicenantes bacterium]
MARTQETKSSGLKKWLARILAPPRFQDEEKDRLARVLNITLLFGFIVAVLTATAAAASGQPGKAMVIAATAVTSLLLQVPLRLGRIRLTIVLSAILMLTLVISLLVIGGSIRDLGSMLFPVIIACGGLVLRPKEFLVLVFLTLLSAIAIILLEVGGLIHPPTGFDINIFNLLTVASIFLLAAVPVRLLANDLKRNIDRARQNEQELRASNEMLQREISERELADSALRESETRFHILADSTFEGLFISENDIIIDANSSLAKMLGCEIKEIIGRNVSDFLDRETAEIDLQQFKSESRTPYEHQLKRPDGTLIPVESRNKMIPYQGRLVRVTTSHDISERRRHEEEYRIMEAEIRQNQKLESLGTLAGGIAHDFNNIISIISGHAAALADKLKKHPEARATLHTINEAAERGSAMVRQILTFARKSEADFRSLQIRELINELVKMLRVTFPRTIEINHTCLQDLPPLWMDPSQMHQALLNLCINARDAMAGTGKLEIATSMIDGEEIACRFPAAEGKRLIRIRISDTGVGMDEATRCRIFEPFFTTKGRGRGTGLGLAVVYGVVKAHNGFIEVDSQIGRGTSFLLYFSAAESPASLTAKADLDTGLIAGGSETILLVEDEEDLCELLAAVLHDQGYGILVAHDGLEALERYRRHRGDIQLVITDMDLPKINGAAVCQAILSSDPKTKIILISGFLETALKNSILASGVREFLAKPYTMPQMLQIVRRVLDGN